jgi:hypothetical protein
MRCIGGRARIRTPSVTATGRHGNQRKEIKKGQTGNEEPKGFDIGGSHST